MVRIRLKRMGAKNQPAYRVVVVDGRSPRDGRFIEEVGYYEPLKKGNNAKLKLDRVDYWIKCGAQPTVTVASMIAKERSTQAV
jgi:small subunit ribosomal protein S16